MTRQTHLLLYASNIAVVCKDTNILTLKILAYSKLNITNTWYLKYDHKKLLMSEK